jgi:hypothetical protein
MPELNPGDVVRIVTDPPFGNDVGDPTDPTNVRLLVRRSGQPPTIYTYGVSSEVAKDSTGTYHADIEITKKGTYYARWEGDGAVVAAEETSFSVVSNFY